MNKNVFLKISMLISLTFLVSCGAAVEDTNVVRAEDQISQQVGDLMASIDEAGTSSGVIAFNEFDGAQKSLQKIAGLPDKSYKLSLFMPEASAASCFGAGFSSCTSNEILRTYGNCSVGNYSFSGTVRYTWGTSTNCVMNGNGSTIKRNPNFTISHSTGASISVIKTGTNGQMLTRTSAGIFDLSNDGIRRNVVKDGITVYDMTTTITSPITVTGASRSSRTITGGTLHLASGITSVTCDLQPTGVAWVGTTCTCPTQGYWQGTCSDTGSFRVTITSCGQGTVSVSGTTRDITFDRCTGS